MSKRLFKEFGPVTKNEWKKKATADLKGKLPDDYNWKLDNLGLGPYYDIEDLSGIQPFDHQARLNTAEEPRYWDNIQQIPVSNEKEANKMALEALEGGADGLIFQISEKTELATLLNDIILKYCKIYFSSSEFTEPGLNNVYDFCSHLKHFQGGIIVAPHESKWLLAKLDNSFKILISSDSKDGSVLDKISTGLYDLTLIFHELTTAGSLTKEKSLQIGFHLRIGKDFFGEIAALRALRQLWFQLVKSYNVKSINPEDLYIIASSTVWNNKEYNPHANMLKGTTAAMAGILGGANAINILSEDSFKTYMARTARNISTILKEESYFSKNADPVAGSYFLETLTDKIAQECWLRLKEKISQL